MRPTGVGWLQLDSRSWVMVLPPVYQLSVGIPEGSLPASPSAEETIAKLASMELLSPLSLPG